MDKIDEKFVAAVKAMEKRTARIGAYVIVDKADANRNGRVTFSRSSGGVMSAVAFLPGEPKTAGVYPYARHHAKARGYGYNKQDAAMDGARFWNVKTGAMDALKDDSGGWQRQLENAGYLVLHAC